MIRSLLTGLTILVCLSAALAGDPAWYARKATWRETLLASRESIARTPDAPGLGLPDFGKDAYTIACWVKTTHDGTLLAKAPAKGKWAPSGKTWFIRGGRLAYDIGWVGATGGRTKVADGQWHHVAVTGPGQIEFFVDGKSDGGGHLDGEPDVAAHVAKIGHTTDNFPAQPRFNGLLDDVRVYRRRLSGKEISALAGGQDVGGAVAAWKMDGSIDDASGNRNHAAASGKLAFAEGRSGQALRLDGKTWLTVASTQNPRQTLWNLLTRDFAEAAAVAQMQAERDAGLWDEDWQAGDAKALAVRFAAALKGEPLGDQAARAAAGVRTAGDLDALASIFHRSRAIRDELGKLDNLDLRPLRLAIQDLGETAGAYPARDLLARLDAIQQALLSARRKAATGADTSAELVKAAEDLAALRREALVRRNPHLGFDKLLFTRRKTYQSSHYYTEYIDGCKHFGGNICILDLKTLKTTDLAPSMSAGIFGRFDLSYDARRVVFDWKKDINTGFRIYEVNIDGSGLRQLTFDQDDEQDLIRKYRTLRTPTGTPYITGVDDMHPCYLPDGDIVFVSTRCQKGILCDGPDVLTSTTLHRMDKDGKNLRAISFNSVSEATPSIMQDGRILYTRWEYVDKGGSACKCIWAMNPDGSNSVEIYANNIAHPTTFIDARDVPGAGNQIVVAGTPHMPLGVGTIIRLNTVYSLRTRDPMTYLTPEIDATDEHGFRHFRNGKWVHDLVGPLAREPYPLNQKYFLIAYNPDKPWNDVAGYGIYLLDEFNNRELIYKESEWSCWQPMPLRERPRPPIIPPAGTGGPSYARTGQPYTPDAWGTLLLQDVYVGMTGIERGRVKYLRVMEDVPRPWAARRDYGGDGGVSQQHVVVCMWGHLACKIEHGIVPVETDGSAYFQVPADRNVFFQALDENYMELQRMRTFINMVPGEYRGCVGCHEEKAVAPAMTKMPLASRRTPDRPAPQPGEIVPRAMHYPSDVQPILDKHCVRCHGGPKPKAELDLTGTMTNQFSVSYENMLKKRLIGKWVDEIGGSGTGGKHAHIESTDPLTYGSHTSKLVAQLRKGHNDVKLSKEEFIRLVTWIDANAPFYGTWEGKRHIRFKDEPDFRPTPKAGPDCTAWSGQWSGLKK